MDPKHIPNLPLLLSLGSAWLRSLSLNLVVLPVDPQWSSTLLRAAGEGTLAMTRSCLQKSADVESTDACLPRGGLCRNMFWFASF